MANRLVELAIEALEARKSAIEEEIKTLRLELRSGRRSRAAAGGMLSNRKPGRLFAKRRGHRMSAAARKAQSLRMKEYWARKRAASASQEAGAKRRGKG